MHTKAAGLRGPAHTTALSSKRRPLEGGEGRGHVSPLRPGRARAPRHLPLPRKTVPRYLSHLEAPLASSRLPAFCRGYWGRGTPCSGRGTRQLPRCPKAVESVGGRSGWAAGCSGFLAVCCLWAQAEDRRPAPRSDCAPRCCSRRTPPGRRALRTEPETRETRCHASLHPTQRTGCSALRP